MRTPDELDAELRELILSIYTRPTMFAMAQCVESELWMAHRCWALLHEREGRFQDLYCQLSRRHRTVHGHYHQYRERNPDGTEKAAYRFIFERWETVSRALGLTVPDSWAHLDE